MIKKYILRQFGEPKGWLKTAKLDKHIREGESEVYYYLVYYSIGKTYKARVEEKGGEIQVRVDSLSSYDHTNNPSLSFPIEFNALK